jgi:hypothetical protein
MSNRRKPRRPPSGLDRMAKLVEGGALWGASIPALLVEPCDWCGLPATEVGGIGDHMWRVCDSDVCQGNVTALIRALDSTASEDRSP